MSEKQAKKATGPKQGSIAGYLQPLAAIRQAAADSGDESDISLEDFFKDIDADEVEDLLREGEHGVWCNELLGDKDPETRNMTSPRHFKNILKQGPIKIQLDSYPYKNGEVTKGKINQDPASFKTCSLTLTQDLVTKLLLYFRR